MTLDEGECDGLHLEPLIRQHVADFGVGRREQLIHRCNRCNADNTKRYRQEVTGPTKTEAGDRSIPIPVWVEILARRAERRGTPIDQGEYLFQTRCGNPVNRDKLRQDVIRPALKRAGLDETIRTYDLRHSHAFPLIVDLKADVLTVSQRMGHTDQAVTLREYGHLFEGAQQKLTDQLDELRESTAVADEPAEIIDISEARLRVVRHEKGTRGTRRPQSSGNPGEA